MPTQKLERQLFPLKYYILLILSEDFQYDKSYSLPVLVYGHTYFKKDLTYGFN